MRKFIFKIIPTFALDLIWPRGKVARRIAHRLSRNTPDGVRMVLERSTGLLHFSFRQEGGNTYELDSGGLDHLFQMTIGQGAVVVRAGRPNSILRQKIPMNVHETYLLAEAAVAWVEKAADSMIEVAE